MPQRSGHTPARSRTRLKRFLAIATAAAAGGAFVLVAQVSNASVRPWGWGRKPPVCEPAAPGQAVTNGQPQQAPAQQTDRRRRPCTPRPGPTTTAGSSTAPASPSASPSTRFPDQGPADCTGSRFQPHDGFQNENRCMDTTFGDVGTVANTPSALFVNTPTTIRVNTPFSLTVSTRNVSRSRFLGAADGGYGLESGRLNAEGAVIGHAHVACNFLPDDDEAPAVTRANVNPAGSLNDLFQALEDGGGGLGADVAPPVNFQGVTQTGTLRCSAWVGTASHFVPVAPFADIQPAFDVIRIEVTE
jgi:hypothetical protein